MAYQDASQALIQFKRAMESHPGGLAGRPKVGKSYPALNERGYRIAAREIEQAFGISTEQAKQYLEDLIYVLNNRGLTISTPDWLPDDMHALFKDERCEVDYKNVQGMTISEIIEKWKEK